MELAPTKHVPFEKLFGVAALVGDTCHEGKGRKPPDSADDVFF
jgi:hypothetical protein